jgi:hypothetical protein
LRQRGSRNWANPRVALTGDDGPNDGQPRRPGDIRYGAVDLYVHLIQGLLDPVNRPDLLSHQVGALPGERPHGDKFGFRSKRTS